MSGIASLQADFQADAKALVKAAGQAGLLPRITSAYRSYAEQEKVYRRFLAGLSPFPAAPPGESTHETGLAFDMIVSPDYRIYDVGDLWTSWGGIYGSDADPVHFEAPEAKRALAELKAQRTAPEAPASGESSQWSAFWEIVPNFIWGPTALMELAHIMLSRSEAEKAARMLGIQP